MKKVILGLYVSDNSTQAIALEQGPTGMLVRALSEWKNTLFSYAGDDTPGVDEFVDQLATFIRDHSLRFSHASVALDTSLVFLQIVPMRNSATRAEIDEHICWELGEYFPTMTDGFITDIHPLTPKNDEMHSSVLVAAVRRDVIHAIRRSLSRLHLSLEVVDVDHFSADTALRYNYPETINKMLALVGIKEHRLDFSLVRHNEIESYSYVVPASPDELVVRFVQTVSATKGLSSISVYGTYLTPEILLQMRQATTIPIETLNPFRSIDVADSLRFHADPTTASYRYCSVVGVALRKD